MDIGSWIPQVFYDLIGRVAPGAFLLILSAVLLLDPASASFLVVLLKEPHAPLALLLLSALVTAYIVGTLLGAIGFALWHGEWTRKAVAAVQLELPQDDDDDKPESGMAFKYDAVLLHEPAAGARLVKLRAEQHLCRVLAIGVFLLVPLYVWRSWPWRASDVGVLAGLALIAWSAYLFYIHLEIRARRLLANYWFLLGKPTRAPERKSGRSAFSEP